MGGDQTTLERIFSAARLVDHPGVVGLHQCYRILYLRQGRHLEQMILEKYADIHIDGCQLIDHLLRRMNRPGCIVTSGERSP